MLALLSGLGVFLAIALLIGGTVVFCLALAIGARAVDRLWDVLASDDDRPDQRRSTPRDGSANLRWRPGTGMSLTIVVTILAAALLSALAWLAFTIGRTHNLA